MPNKRNKKLHKLIFFTPPHLAIRRCFCTVCKQEWLDCASEGRCHTCGRAELKCPRCLSQFTAVRLSGRNRNFSHERAQYQRIAIRAMWRQRPSKILVVQPQEHLSKVVGE